MPSTHHHRAGSLRQSNKKNKRSNASKRSMSRKAGGKVMGTSTALRSVRKNQNKNIGAMSSKAKRLLMAKQRRDNKKKKLLGENRMCGGSFNPVSRNIESPKVVGLVSLSAENDQESQIWEAQVIKFLNNENKRDCHTKSADNIFEFPSYGKQPIMILTNSQSFSKHYKHQKDQQRDTTENDDQVIVDKNKVDNNDAGLDDIMDDGSTSMNDTNDYATIMGALDLCRVCDLIIFAINGDNVREKIAYSKRSNRGGDQNLNNLESCNDTVSVFSQNTSKTNATSATTADWCDEYFVSSRGERILTVCKAQGLPTTLTLLTHSATTKNVGANESSNRATSTITRDTSKVEKCKKDMKRYAQRFANTEFGDDSRMMEVDISSDQTTSSIFSMDNENSNDDSSMMITDGDTKESTTQFGNSTEGAESNSVNTTLSLSQGNINDKNKAFIRYLCTGNASPPKWVDSMPRPYIISQSATSSQADMTSDDYVISSYGHSYDKSKKELSFTGYVRGLSGNSPFSIYRLLHIPHLGTYSISKMKVLSKSHKKAKAIKERNNSDEEDEDNVILPLQPELVQDSLNMFATPDSLEGEQNLIGFDGDDCSIDNVDEDGKDEVKSRPAGWSEYQSAWLDAIDGDNEQQDDLQQDHGELGSFLNAKKEDKNLVTDDDDNVVDREEMKLQKRMRAQKEDAEFPDEVEIKMDELARDRFARYRSLKSFRKSFWDPKENLPESYAKIYHFAKFKNTQRDVIEDQHYLWNKLVKRQQEQQMKEDGKGSTSVVKDHDVAMSDNESDIDGDADQADDNLIQGSIVPGSFIEIIVSNVPSHLYEQQISSNAPLCAVSLLPHENKVTVLHMGITSKKYSLIQDEENEGTTATVEEQARGGGIIKSKDTLTFRCGWRTWKGRPVFSQNNLNSDKHKLERFLPPSGAFLAASVFGPVCFTPCPVLCFSFLEGTANPRSNNRNPWMLAATGSVLGADADRIVIKRIVLTGYPTRVHKRHATVKYMFYNPDDVKWFKPAGLTSKHGLQGNIIESVGDHGTMKCLFNQPIKQHDTVCLPLYKRIYPKFAPETIPSEDVDVDDRKGGEATNKIKKDLVVL